jgi:hypothetical protein
MRQRTKLILAIALIVSASVVSAFLFSALNSSKTHQSKEDVVYPYKYFIYHVTFRSVTLESTARATPIFLAGYVALWLAGGLYVSRMRRTPLIGALYRDSFAFILSFCVPFILASDYRTSGLTQLSAMRAVFVVFAVWKITPPALAAIRWPVRRRALHVFGISLCIFLAAGFCDYSRHISGDEPHYLIIADSMLEDGDLDVRNNYESQSYHRYYPSDLTRAEHVIKISRNGTREVWSPQHFPAIAVMAMPFHALFGPWAAKLPLMFCAALTVMLVYLLAARLGLAEGKAAAWSFAFALLLPITAYSNHLYPEMPVAFLAISALYLCSAGKMSGRSVALCALIAAAFPWFGMRSLPFTVGAIICVIANNPRAVRRWLLALVPSAVSIVLVGVYYYAVFGAIQPGIEHRYHNNYAFNISMLTSVRYLGAIFFDNETGVFLYIPLLMLAVPGFVIGWRIARKFTVYTLLLVVPYMLLLILGYSSWHGDWAPVGRFMASACPLIFIGVVFSLRGLAASDGVAKVLLGLSWVFTAILCVDPKVLYNSGTGIPRLLSEKHIPINYIAPSFMRISVWTYALTAAWLAAVAVLTCVTLRKAGRKSHVDNMGAAS